MIRVDKNWFIGYPLRNSKFPEDWASQHQVVLLSPWWYLVACCHLEPCSLLPFSLSMFGKVWWIAWDKCHIVMGWVVDLYNCSSKWTFLNSRSTVSKVNYQSSHLDFALVCKKNVIYFLHHSNCYQTLW